MRLGERLGAARRAIHAAGFASGKWLPRKGLLLVELIVPVPFEDAVLKSGVPSDYVFEHVERVCREKRATRASVAEVPAVGVARPAPDPLTVNLRPDLRTREGRAWKAAQEAIV